MFDPVELTVVDEAADEVVLVEQIAWLDRVKSAAAAGQARAAALLDAQRRAAQAAAGVPAGKRGRGLASEVALARRDSPARGGRHLGLAAALVHEMPHPLAALACGVLSEWRATLIVRESACLNIAERRTLDAEMCGDRTGLEGLGDARIVAKAKDIAARLDVQAVADRAAKAEADRTVTIRPQQRRAGRHGVGRAALPARSGPIHRAARSAMSHPLLRRPDPPHPPRRTQTTRRPHPSTQRAGVVRAMQLQQRSTRLAGQHLRGRRCARSRLRHPHRSTPPPPPGPPTVEVTEIETRIAIELVHLHAA